MDDDATRIVVGGRADATLDEQVHYLELVGGGEGARRFVVEAGGAVIGRREPADIVLAGGEVSRSHCRLEPRGGELAVADLGSTNGTFVDGVRVEGAGAALPVGGLLQVGGRALRHGRGTRRDVMLADELDRDLARAADYVLALLPAPIAEGPIRADWRYQPSAKLGGDAFGYGSLPDGRFACYLIDVSGHGAGPALHGVAVMNLLRQRALPGADAARPGEVLAALNEMFQMERHAELYFTLWYGVFDPATRRLEFASAGHHPAFLRPADGSEAAPLRTRNPMIGAMPQRSFQTDAVSVPPGASLFLFSDGVFEIVTREGRQWGLQDFLPLILRSPADALAQSELIFNEVMAVARPGGLDDDFSLVVLTFD